MTKFFLVALFKRIEIERNCLGEVVTVELEHGLPEQADNPWRKLCGKYHDDPTWDDFQANIAAYRRQLNEEDAALSHDPLLAAECLARSVVAAAGVATVV